MEDKKIPEYYPGSYYQPLFDYLQDQFGVLALESDMTEIIEIINRMKALHPSESAGVKGAVWIETTVDLPAIGDTVLVEYTGGHFERKEYTGLPDWWKRNVKRWLNEDTAAGASAVWVKATDVDIVYNKTYFVKWVKGKSETKGTGWFQKSDGTFFWNIQGCVPVLEKERENLFLLDESPAAAQSGKEEAQQTNPGDTLPPDIIDKLLKARDALVQRDVNGAYHWLYAIASPHFDKLKPWAEMENKRAAQPNKEDFINPGIEYRGPAHHCKACENEAKGIKHIKAEKHTCHKNK